VLNGFDGSQWILIDFQWMFDGLLNGFLMDFIDLNRFWIQSVIQNVTQQANSMDFDLKCDSKCDSASELNGFRFKP
jgi:hypothetical protein